MKVSARNSWEVIGCSPEFCVCALQPRAQTPVPLRCGDGFGIAGAQHRLGHHERAHCRGGCGGGRRAHHCVCGRGQRRRVEVGEWRHHFQAGV